MDDLHELAVAIADTAYQNEQTAWDSSVAYMAVYRAVMDNADKIAFVHQLHKPPRRSIAEMIADLTKPHPNQREIDRKSAELLKSTKPMDDDVKVDPMDLITVIDAHNDLHDALMDILAYARRDPENLGDADAILTDILERAQEALNG